MTESGFVLADFRSVELSPPIRQDRLVSYCAWLMASARCSADDVTDADEATMVLRQLQEKFKRYAVNPQQIKRRQFNAFSHLDQVVSPSAQPAFPDGYEDLTTHPKGPTLDKRMRSFDAVALQVFERWYEDQRTAPDELIHVTCSGYASPSPAQRFLADKRWHFTGVTNSYHMDCYGAFPAIRTGVGLLAPGLMRSEPKHRVDIIHTEYLSAHIATLKEEPGDIINMTLFGDGFIGYSLYPLHVYRQAGVGAGLRILACHEQLLPNSTDAMSWTLGAHHFDIFLSKEVPLLIRENVADFARVLCRHAGVDLDRERSRLLFAIHPGGPKILDHCAEALQLTEQQLAHSRDVFRELGNMSSATVPHVLMNLARDRRVQPGTLIVALGFGPGLTATGALLEKVAA